MTPPQDPPVASVDVEIITSSSATTQVLQEEDEELTRRIKDRHRRRLLERWKCHVQDHTYCYADRDGAHAPLREEAIEAWVTALHNGAATLLSPPQSIGVLNKPPFDVDGDSVTSTTARSIVQHQRAFRLGKVSLTDLRSAQVRLHDSLSSTAVSSLSTTSSGVPGIGYLSGKMIKWVGMQMLNGFVPLEICRRRWVIRRLINRIQKLSTEEGAEWLIRKERKVMRAVENLLELSSENYKRIYRIRAIEQGVVMKDFIYMSMYELDLKSQTNLSSMAVKVFPLYLLQYDTPATQDFAGNLRETLLQEEEPAEELLLAEIATRLCIELAYGPQSVWRSEGYEALWNLYQTLCCKQHLQSLDTFGVLMEDMAKRSFGFGERGIVERAATVQFFSEYANDVPRFRDYMSESTGIPFLISAIKGVAAGVVDTPEPDLTLWHVSETLAQLSVFRWCIPTLARLDLCSALVELLCVDQRGRDSTMQSWVAYCIIHILRNLSVLGEGEGPKVVRDAVTNELLTILPNVEGIVRRRLGEYTSQRVIIWITETWPEALAEINNSM